MELQLNRLSTVGIFILTLTACSAGPMPVDRQAAEELPPEIAFQWLETVPRIKPPPEYGGFAKVEPPCSYHESGIESDEQGILPFTNWTVSYVNSRSDSYKFQTYAQGEIHLVPANASFAKGCFAYYKWENSNNVASVLAGVQQDIKKTLTALLVLGVNVPSKTMGSSSR